MAHSRQPGRHEGVGNAQEVLLGEPGHDYHHRHDMVEPYVAGEAVGSAPPPGEETRALHSARWERGQADTAWALPMSGLQPRTRLGLAGSQEQSALPSRQNERQGRAVSFAKEVPGVERTLGFLLELGGLLQDSGSR